MQKKSQYMQAQAWHETHIEKQERVVREFVPLNRLIAAPDVWKRIQEYRAIRSLHD